jgi:hypothetical protein
MQLVEIGSVLDESVDRGEEGKVVYRRIGRASLDISQNYVAQDGPGRDTEDLNDRKDLEGYRTHCFSHFQENDSCVSFAG